MAGETFTVRAGEVEGLPVWHVVDPEGRDRSTHVYESDARRLAARLSGPGFAVEWRRPDGVWMLATVVQSMADADAECDYFEGQGCATRVQGRRPAVVSVASVYLICPECGDCVNDPRHGGALWGPDPGRPAGASIACACGALLMVPSVPGVIG